MPVYRLEPEDPDLPVPEEPDEPEAFEVAPVELLLLACGDLELLDFDAEELDFDAEEEEPDLFESSFLF